MCATQQRFFLSHHNHGASDTDTASTSGTVAGSDVGAVLCAPILLSSIAYNFTAFPWPLPVVRFAGTVAGLSTREIQLGE